VIEVLRAEGKVAKRYNVTRAELRQWVETYQAEGRKALGER
jgi:hypothetical protein